MKKLLLLSSNPINKDLGLLLIRLIIGLLMAFYGYEKLSHFSEMASSDFWAKNVSFLGMTGKTPLALTIFAELFCSVLLIFGLFSRISTMILMFCMGYIFLVVFPFSIINQGDNGHEFNTAFVYFMIYLGLFFTGPGKYSLDHKFFKK
ncbi:DoxX family protein [Flavobacterium sp.]|uniref:DoxX family protein n=1 Tax=Flavobacterium sp. TaxID=239 RepID=UPI0037502767